MNIVLDEALNQHTTFKIGGKAKYFTEPSNIEELQQSIAYAKEQGVPYFVLGNGSNILAKDEGFEGLVIVTTNMNQMERRGENYIYASAGTRLSVLAGFAAEQGLSGLEFAGGIPGTVGGGVYMNCGAYGGEIAQSICKVTYLDSDGDIKEIPAQELQLSYRHSIFKEHRDWVIIGAEFCLQQGNRAEIEAKMREMNGARRAKQPLEYPSAGSTFKRPDGHFAAKLIEDCGLKGLTVGGAQVSEKHAGFVINKGGATAADVLNLIDKIKEIVYEKTGVMLECEIQCLGE